jgi:hypothetical protein
VGNHGLPPSGELFELEEELKRVVSAFRKNQPIVSGEDLRKRVLVCLEAERFWAERKEIKLIIWSPVEGVLIIDPAI